LKTGKYSKWLSPFVIASILVSMLLIQAGMASAATLQPFISPAGGAFTTAQTVTIYNIANGDTAYYTTDGSNPETSGTRIAYNGPFIVSQSETVQAVSYDSTTGWSTVTSAVFTISGSSTLDAPVISPDGGSYTTAQPVTISDIYGTAYYTTDGSNPETSSTRITYTGTFNVNQSETVNVANQDQYGNWSTVTSAVFSIGNSSSTQLQSGYQPHRKGIRVFARGREINFDTQPIIVNGSTLIPIRQIAAALGLPDNDVQWNAANGTVNINNGSNKMTIRNNERQVYLNGKAHATDAPAQIVNGRMMVPLRAISQLFNKNIQWDSSSGTITIQ
jgi:hypothetical protein